MVGGRIKYFESSNKYHFLDYKFKKTRIVNLTEEYDCIHLHSSSTFFRQSSIRGNKFDKEVNYGEDAKFISNLLLFKPIIGFLKEAIYFYRKRADSTSAIQNTEQNLNYYFSTIINVQIYLINKSKELFNQIVSFIQYYLAYEMIFRILSPAYKFLDSINYKKYIKLLESIIIQIEDKYIMEQKNFNIRKKIFILSIKYKKDIRYNIKINEYSLIYSNYNLFNFDENKDTIFWRILEIKQNILHLEGQDILWLPRDKYFYIASLGDKLFYPKYQLFSEFDFKTIYGTKIKGRVVIFDIVLDILNTEELHFYICYLNKKIEIKTSFSILTHLPPLNNSYYLHENFIIKNNNNKLMIFHYNKDLKNLFEQNYCQELKLRKKNHLINFREEYIYNYNINNSLSKKIWLINDKQNKAGDNGEYLFRYLSKIKPKDISFYFIIENNSSDYNRLKTFGNIIDFNSSEHLKFFLKSDKIISSIYDSWVNNPFYEEGKFLCDLYHFDLIYLQNGIIKDDLSKYINKYLKNYNLVVISSEKEYQSLLQYGYNINNIALTGLTRFDNLIKLQKIVENKKFILLLPTYRTFIKGTINSVSNENIKSENFKNTSFYQFYNQLINDINLFKIMKKYNYTGIFCLHQNFAAQLNDFDKNEIFVIKENCYSQELFVNSSLLITDYSNAFFDLGYIKKPIIYIQFDYDDYRLYQFPKGYFNYKKYGFGPICYNMECILKEIISYIKNNCQLKHIYNKRINHFFKYSDDNNSRRTYNAIIQGIVDYDIIKPNIKTNAYFLIFFIFIFLKIYKLFI